MTAVPDRDPLTRVRIALTTIVRRGSMRAQRSESGLSQVEQTLLALVAAQPGTRAVDIADRFDLNKSTVSRQLARLTELELVRADAADDRRGAGLTLTDAGREVEERSSGRLEAELRERFADWTDAEITTFAELLERFVASAA